MRPERVCSKTEECVAPTSSNGIDAKGFQGEINE